MGGCAGKEDTSQAGQGTQADTNAGSNAAAASPTKRRASHRNVREAYVDDSTVVEASSGDGSSSVDCASANAAGASSGAPPAKLSRANLEKSTGTTTIMDVYAAPLTPVKVSGRFNGHSDWATVCTEDGAWSLRQTVGDELAMDDFLVHDSFDEDW